MPRVDDTYVSPELRRELERRIPRYTSYPTAPQFSASVTADTYAQWLEQQPRDAALSLYLHVPFCAALCLYCGCNTAVARSYSPVAAYVDLLEREIDLVAGHLGSRRPVTQVHWGGGTPTMLSPADFLRLTERLRDRFAFRPDTESAIEIDPRTITPDHVRVLAEAGITRASLGVQDFEFRVQQAIGRTQSYAQTVDAADRLHAAGVKSINLDLIYGLPYQSVSSVKATMRLALTINPDRIALFGYAHVPWMKRHQKLLPEQALPETEERFAQSQAAAEVLTGAGYVAIGLDHFAKPHDLLARRQREGRLHRNFQGYTTDEASTLIGFGTSAIGALPQGYLQNASGTPAYREAVMGGRFATVRGYALTDNDRLRGAIIERLMCDLRVDVAAVAATHGMAGDFTREMARIDVLARDGIVRRADTTIVIPGEARPFVRTVCAVFDAYLAESDGRFSRAV